MLHIVCFGNLWQGDDGFGIHVFRRLSAWRLPPHVKVFDAGTAGLSALDYFENCQKVVVVDAIRSDGKVGSVRRLLPELKGNPSGVRDNLAWEHNPLNLPEDQETQREFSIHGLGVDCLLQVLPVVFEEERLPSVVLIGAEIGRISPFTDRLSAPLQAALKPALKFVQNEWLNYDLALSI